jgi:hypothetical protein
LFILRPPPFPIQLDVVYMFNDDINVMFFISCVLTFITSLHHGRMNFKDTNPSLSSLLVIFVSHSLPLSLLYLYTYNNSLFFILNCTTYVLYIQYTQPLYKSRIFKLLICSHFTFFQLYLCGKCKNYGKIFFILSPELPLHKNTDRFLTLQQN